MAIEESKGYCCEACGNIIHGECNNENGYVTHIEQCSSYYCARCDEPVKFHGDILCEDCKEEYDDKTKDETDED